MKVKLIMILTEQVRIIPQVNYSVIEVVYKSVEVKLKLSEYDIAYVDLGSE